MEDDSPLSGNLTDFHNRLGGADLVIGVHYGNQDGLTGNSPADVIQSNKPIFIHRQIGDLKSQPFLKIAASIEHGRVFYTHGNDMLSLGYIRQCGSDYSLVIALAPAAGKDDLLRHRAN